MLMKVLLAGCEPPVKLSRIPLVLQELSCVTDTSRQTVKGILKDKKIALSHSIVTKINFPFDISIAS